MPENVAYITELIAYYCYEGSCYTVCLVANWCEFMLVVVSF